MKKLLKPVMPQREGEVYHLVCMQWYKEWQHYTGFDKEEETVFAGSSVTTDD